MQFFGNSDKGMKRPENQDSLLIEKLNDEMILFLVCDGMGGAKGGSVASSLASTSFVEYLKKNLKKNNKEGQLSFDADSTDITDILNGAITYANSAVYKKSARSKRLAGMGTTLVGCIIHGEKMYIINVGDSRLYLSCSDGKLIQMTHDHSYVQALVDLGKITPEEAATNPHKNIITKAIGISANEQADVFCREIEETDEYILLCSDGLTNFVDEKRISNIISEYKDADKICNTLISEANENGGGDNITAIVVKLKD